MKIIFEFESGESYTIYGIRYSKINEKSAQNHLLDELLSDPNTVKMYIIADDNRVVV